MPAGALVVLLALFVVANFSYEAGQPFYNALLYSVADGAQARLVSGVGVALGYVGSIVGMILVLPFVTGDLFGLDVPLLSGWGKAGAFLPTAVLFLLFAIPLFVWVRERPVVTPRRAGFGEAYREVWEGIRQTRRYPGVLRFLIADYFFEDAVATVILNIGLYCSLVLLMDDRQITGFLTISTATAVVGSFVIGKLAVRWSLKQLMRAIVVGWVIVLVLFAFVEWRPLVWVLGSVVGVLLGGLWTVSRPLLAELVPREELGRFFGLFALSGRAAAVIGPLIWTAIVYSFAPERYLGRVTAALFNIPAERLASLPYRVAVLALAAMMVAGLVIFRKVPDPAGRPSAPRTSHG